MKLIEEIEERLSKYPHVRYETGAASITVLPTSDDGFTVRLDIARERYVVSFNGWHEEFTELKQALNCFTFGLSDNCRLKECRRGDFAYKWIVEGRSNGNWVSDSETGLLFFPFWRKKEVRYLQNNLIPLNDEGDS